MCNSHSHALSPSLSVCLNVALACVFICCCCCFALLSHTPIDKSLKQQLDSALEKAAQEQQGIQASLRLLFSAQHESALRAERDAYEAILPPPSGHVARCFLEDADHVRAVVLPDVMRLDGHDDTSRLDDALVGTPGNILDRIVEERANECAARFRQWQRQAVSEAELETWKWFSSLNPAAARTMAVGGLLEDAPRSGEVRHERNFSCLLFFLTL